MWRAAVLCSLAGCFHPSPVTGIPCSEGLHCPGDQVCDTSQAPPTCVEHLTDAGPEDTTDAGDDAPDASQVLGCAKDTDCPGGVCHEMTGECIPEDEVAFVAQSGIDNAQCTRMLPCASLSNAFSRLTSMKRTIAVADGTYTAGVMNFHVPGTSTFLISGSHAGWDGAVLKMSIVVDGPIATIEGVTIQNGAQTGVENRSTITLSRVLVASAGNHCVDNRGDLMTVLDSKLDNCPQTGITSTAQLDLERTIITNNKAGGVEVSAKSTIVNNVIARNGQIAAGSFGGAKLSAPLGQVTFRFNTVASNQSIDPQVAPGVACTNAATVEDSIIANNSQLVSQVSMQCNVRYSLFDVNAPAGTGNVTGTPMFVSPPSDYHLQSTSPAIDNADPAATETIDFEGGHRPTGAARDIGADETP